MPSDIKTQRIDDLIKLRLARPFVSTANRIKSYIFRQVQKCNLDLGDRAKTKEFNKSIHELVTILFAVVLGLGLEQLNNIDKDHFVSDLLLLLIGYLAVVLSWWFYHKGIIAGPKENNVLLYIVDCLLMIVYWFLINSRGNLIWLLVFYATMFLLYLIWEVIRIFQKLASPDADKVKKARHVNLLFFLFSLLFIEFLHFKIYFIGSHTTYDRIICLVVISILVVSYRIPISRIYGKDRSTEPQSA